MTEGEDAICKGKGGLGGGRGGYTDLKTAESKRKQNKK